MIAIPFYNSLTVRKPACATTKRLNFASLLHFRGFAQFMGSIFRGVSTRLVAEQKIILLLNFVTNNQIFIILARYCALAVYKSRSSSTRLNAWATQQPKNIAAVESRLRHCVRFDWPGNPNQDLLADTDVVITYCTNRLVTSAQQQQHE